MKEEAESTLDISPLPEYNLALFLRNIHITPNKAVLALTEHHTSKKGDRAIASADFYKHPVRLKATTEGS